MIEIITIGDELTCGRTADENSRFIAQELAVAGLGVSRIITVGDAVEGIIRALQDMLPGTRFVIATGGLGPTDDDRTAPAAAAAFGRTLGENREAMALMENRYREFGRAMPPAAVKQAVLPEGCRIIPNPVGTACGFSIDDGDRQFLFLPGVPEEVRAMTSGFLIPHILQASGSENCIVSRTLKVFGLWESQIHELLRGSLPATPAVSLGYYPQYPEVSLKITGTGRDRGAVEQEVEAFQHSISEIIGEYLYSLTGESLEEVVGALLNKRGETLAIAESCTGGLIAHRITGVPGSSGYFDRSVVVYSNRAKEALLQVPRELLDRHGAVSMPVARIMAQNVRQLAETTYGLAVTGIAGPGGGTPEKPVGTVFIGLSSAASTQARQYQFSGTREKIKIMTAQVALNLLKTFIQPRA